MMELADNATHENIQEYVDQIVEDRKGKEEEEKRDSQQITEEPAGDTTAEDASGSDDTADKGEEAEHWLDDDLKAEAAAYGIDEKDIADFTSREELERALRFFARRTLETGRKAMTESPERDEKGRFARSEEEEDGAYKVNLDAEQYDEGLIAEFARLRDHYESRVAALEARFAEADARTEERQFDAVVDGLGHADLFGKAGKESARELQRRQDLFVAVKAQQIGLEQLGRETSLDEALVRRVVRMVFPEELRKKDLKAHTRKVSKQSDGRMGGGSTKSRDKAESLRDEMRRLYKELEGA
jgi:hypothetical protein